MYAQPMSHYPTMVQAINNPDGTVSIIQMDPNSHAVVTLPDGTQAQVRALSAVRVSQVFTLSIELTHAFLLTDSRERSQ